MRTALCLRALWLIVAQGMNSDRAVIFQLVYGSGHIIRDRSTSLPSKHQGAIRQPKLT